MTVVTPDHFSRPDNVIMLQRVLSLGLSLLLGNWIQIVALVTHDCQAATHLQAATTAAESTSPVGHTHPQTTGHDCCPHPTKEVLISHTNGLDREVTS